MLQIVEKQFSSAEFVIRKVKMFRFSGSCSCDPYVEVHFKRELKGGWNMALQLGNKVRIGILLFLQAL